MPDVTPAVSETARTCSQIEGAPVGARPDAGRIAARGLQYQFVSTLEYALDLMERHPQATTRIEGATGSEGADDVDFDAVDADGRRLVAAQIKTSGAVGGVSAAIAFD